MTEYEVTLRFAIPQGMTREEIEACLFEAGCDDALSGTGQEGRLGVAFAREAATAEEAVTSALRDVRKAIPEARLIEANPDLVGVSDIADLFRFSRQNMRKLIQTHHQTFPLPIHEGRLALWHLVDVLDWFVAEGRDVDTSVRETALACMKLNLGRETERLQSIDERPLAAVF